MKSFDELTAMYNTFEDLLTAFERMSPTDEDYESHRKLVAWCCR